MYIIAYNRYTSFVIKELILEFKWLTGCRLFTFAVTKDIMPIYICLCDKIIYKNKIFIYINVRILFYLCVL